MLFSSALASFKLRVADLHSGSLQLAAVVDTFSVNAQHSDHTPFLAALSQRVAIYDNINVGYTQHNPRVVAVPCSQKTLCMLFMMTPVLVNEQHLLSGNSP